uniref:Uncharacterized protein n=1 Tax=Micrurus corallinus TaxID=54390 RepID=A0A2D4F827_MICCO
MRPTTASDKLQGPVNGKRTSHKDKQLCGRSWAGEMGNGMKWPFRVVAVALGLKSKTWASTSGPTLAPTSATVQGGLEQGGWGDRELFIFGSGCLCMYGVGAESS